MANDRITQLRERVRRLISINDDTYKNIVKPRWTFLYKYLDELNEIETLERIKNWDGGKYLLAYLAYKTISRANFQLEHLEITNCEGDTERLLEMMEKDIELAENNLNKPPREPNATELLQMLKKKIEWGEIKGWLFKDGIGYILETPDYRIDLEQIEVQDPKAETDKFFDKHGIKLEDKQDLVKCPKCDNTQFYYNDNEKRYYCQQHPKEIISVSKEKQLK